MIALLRFSITEINLGFSVQIALVISSEEEETLVYPLYFFSLSTLPLSFHPRSNACLALDGRFADHFRLSWVVVEMNARLFRPYPC